MARSQSINNISVCVSLGAKFSAALARPLYDWEPSLSDLQYLLSYAKFFLYSNEYVFSIIPNNMYCKNSF